MKAEPLLYRQAQPQGCESTPYTSSSGSDRSRNTWNSSTRGLVQIGSLKFEGTDQDDNISLGEDSIHQFSVIIHDNTDANSLAVASHNQIDGLHGLLEDSNVAIQQGRGVKIFGKLKRAGKDDHSSQSLTSCKKKNNVFLQRQPGRDVQATREDSSGYFNDLEELANRDEQQLVDTIEPQPRKPEVASKFSTQVTKESLEPVLEVERISATDDEERDALDTVFERVESMTCGPPIKAKAQVVKSMHGVKKYKNTFVVDVDERDPLDRVFDGVEVMTCGPDSSHDIPIFKKYAGKMKERKNKNPQQQPGQVSGHVDIIDHTFETIELFTCHGDDTNQRLSHEPDMLDKVFGGAEEATCSQKTPKRGNMTRKSEDGTAEHPIELSEDFPDVKIRGSDGDAGDSLCEGVKKALYREEQAGMNHGNHRDVMDHMVDPSCAGSEDGSDSHTGNSMMASESASVDDANKRDSAAIAKGDILDFIFETVEAKTCHHSDDDQSMVPSQSTKTAPSAAKWYWI